jgi:hypothetical protein
MNNTPDNIIINAKKGRSNDFPYDDPAYSPRIVTETKTVIRNGIKVEVTKTRNTSPVLLPQAIRQAMQQLPWQNGVSANPNYISPRKNPRIVNNSKKYNRRGKQVRPVILLRFNKNAMTLIKNNEKSALLNNDGTIKKSNLNRILSKKENKIASKCRI